jgi:hypothetical protein
MKNTLLIITLLFSFSAIGADKPTASVNGLEGFGIDGVKIGVLNPEKHTAQEVKAIEHQSELALLKVGLKRNNNATDNIQIDVTDLEIDGSFKLNDSRIFVQRRIEWENKDEKRYVGWGYVLATGTNFNSNSRAVNLDNVLRVVTSGYLKANPKK